MTLVDQNNYQAFWCSVVAARPYTRRSPDRSAAAEFGNGLLAARTTSDREGLRSFSGLMSS